jgi:small subunit ribosomal protein S17
MENKKPKMQEKKEKQIKADNKNERLSTTRLLSRGKIFEGTVTKKFPTRIVVEFERVVYVPKYERFYKKKTRLHARILNNLDVNIGDYVSIQECRPLSKIIHFVLVKKIRPAIASKEAKTQ